MKISLFVTGNLTCDRSEAREHRGALARQRGFSPTEGLYEIIALDGSDIPDEFDLSQAVIIDGDVRVTGSLTMGGNVVCNKFVEV
jgi:hypothetical protein